MATATNKISPQLKPLAVPLDGLNLDPANARQHDERGIGAVKASLGRFGQLKPIVVQKKGRIVRAGNATVVAARELGWTEIAANVKAMSDVEARAYGIADNRTAELASWDDEQLAAILAELQADDSIDESVTGFTEADLAEVLARVKGKAEIVEDEVPEPPVDPITKPGDLWLLGNHRVLCGDSTKAEDVGRAMGGEEANVVFADPPYGVDYRGQRVSSGKFVENKQPAIAGDSEDAGAIYEGFLRCAMPHVGSKAAFYIWFAASHALTTYQAVIGAGVRPKSLIIWHKVNTGFGNLNHRYKQKHEPCIYGSKRGEADSWYGPNNEVTVWDVEKHGPNAMHPTQKPVALPARALRNSSPGEGLVFDPFLGSGTTLIAAEQLGRRCYGIEIEPRYVDVIVKRWEKLTGKRAKLEGSGKRFPR